MKMEDTYFKFIKLASWYSFRLKILVVDRWVGFSWCVGVHWIMHSVLNVGVTFAPSAWDNWIIEKKLAFVEKPLYLKETQVSSMPHLISAVIVPVPVSVTVSLSKVPVPVLVSVKFKLRWRCRYRCLSRLNTKCCSGAGYRHLYMMRMPVPVSVTGT